MLRKLKFTGVLLAVVMLAGGTMMFVQAKDLRRNYTLVDASIVSVSVDCFIQAGRKKVLVKGTKDLLYMDCALAPDVAAERRRIRLARQSRGEHLRHGAAKTHERHGESR
jgi:hypothetical protein